MRFVNCFIKKSGPMESQPVRKTLFGAFTLVAAALLISAILAAYYFSINFARHEQTQYQANAHQLLLGLLRPALEVSDFMSVQSILGLASKEEMQFAVLTKNGQLLVSDAAMRPGFELASKTVIADGCSKLKGKILKGKPSEMRGSCTSIVNSSLDSSGITALNEVPSAFLLSLRREPALMVSPMDVVGIGAMIFILFLMSLLFLRSSLTKSILRPIEDLARAMRALTDDKSEGHPKLIGGEGCLPKELSDLRTVANKLLTKVREGYAERVELDKAKAISQIASQVAHDIRSPLSALNMVMKNASALPEEQRHIIRNATQRINDIANGLLTSGKGEAAFLPKELCAPEGVGPVMLVSLLDSMVSEKRTQFSEKLDVEIQGDLVHGYGLFAKIDPIELARVISNLVNNSVEAFSGPGRVTISIGADGVKTWITVNDNGKGIPPELLGRLGAKGITYGKNGTSSGSGIGLFHAKQVIEKAGGMLNIQSQVGVGTSITLTLPRAAAPSWFVEKIGLPLGALVVSADDDQTIHQIWTGRLTSAGSAKAGIKHTSFTSLDKFVEWAGFNKERVTQFLIDYEFLGQSGNGLDAIERAGIPKKAILVTSRYEEPQVRARAEAMGVKIIPKGLAPYVPLEIERPKVKYDAILIDDDFLTHMTWQMSAKENGKTILCFESAEEFFAKATNFEFNTPLYVDVSLAHGVRGEAVADASAQLGFSTIYLATGHEASSLTKPSCVRGIVGKDPVFY